MSLLILCDEYEERGFETADLRKAIATPVALAPAVVPIGLWHGSGFMNSALGRGYGDGRGGDRRGGGLGCGESGDDALGDGCGYQNHYGYIQGEDLIAEEEDHACSRRDWD